MDWVDWSDEQWGDEPVSPSSVRFDGSDASPRGFSRPVEPLQKHDVKDNYFVKPAWCDICEGVLTGNGIQCMGPCGRKCHRGVGKNTFNCYASLLASPCDCSVEPIKEGRYRFRDMFRQWGRDLRTSAKELVVVEAFKEQQKLGNVSKVKDLAFQLRSHWDEARANRYFVVGQLASIAVVHCLTYLVTLLVGAPLHGEHGWRLACLQAAHSVNLLLMFEGSLVLVVFVLARQAQRYSELIHAFAKEILFLDVQELHIDVWLAGAAVERVTTSALLSTGALAVLSAAVWLREFVLAGDCR
mmetsp:Transcript_49912/g.143710  ORF Transcript_49912/g.143710 Transcript_49912/m.143710 type:complete len:299 (-) Transcript_49912:188-1084(-)|eukprot:CAMPEP_0176047394 /NCGR_PEP_ID=MMETSP0120_2-20121206/23538_1 /TAXON_ID=160619 /ORGANISM="Kryptoperidinium foliaceum, Strain CCMP 1326" /LENGTH=298 /DNA_ID=CAMNT_0017380809 /DNA_START=49 /DNA_END=945 /DNA_ORIENTATION=-